MAEKQRLRWLAFCANINNKTQSAGAERVPNPKAIEAVSQVAQNFPEAYLPDV